jgi:hypothetical protein
MHRACQTLLCLPLRSLFVIRTAVWSELGLGPICPVRCLFARGYFKKPDDICTFISLWHVETHIVVGNQRFRIGKPPIQRSFIPCHVRGLQSVRILEGGNAACRPAIDISQPRTLLVLIQGVAPFTAFFKELCRDLHRLLGIRPWLRSQLPGHATEIRATGSPS